MFGWFSSHETASGGSRKIVFAVLLLLFVVGVAIHQSCQLRHLGSGRVVLADGSVVTVEVASTAETRERGLAGQEELAPGQGMLFVFPSANRYGFWMKDMLIPIDIVWLEQGRVVDISPNVPVPSQYGPFDVYRPLVPVDQVLELPAGYAEAQNIRLGDQLTIEVDSSSDKR